MGTQLDVMKIVWLNTQACMYVTGLEHAGRDVLVTILWAKVLE